MGLAAAAALAAMALEPRRVLLYAVGPAMILYAFHNWDLLAVGLATLAMYAYIRRADGWAGLLLGLGAATKLYPCAAAPGAGARRLEAEPPPTLADGARVRGRRRRAESSCDDRELPRMAVSVGLPVEAHRELRDVVVHGLPPLPGFLVLRLDLRQRPVCCHLRRRGHCAHRARGAARASAAVRARLRNPGRLPADGEGLLAAVRALAAPVLRAAPHAVVELRRCGP